FTSSLDLQKVEWFQNMIFQKLRREIKTAKIFKIYRSEVLTIVYFEFLDLTKYSEAQIERELIRYSKILYAFSNEILNVFSGADIPELITDFREHFEYKRNIISARNILEARGINPYTLEKTIESSKRIITHGD